MIRILLAMTCLVACLGPAQAQSSLKVAFDNAVAAYEQAYPRLGAEVFGVDTAAYRDALTLRRFSSRHWGGTVDVAVTTARTAEGACNRYAAYVQIPPENGRIALVACPQFLNEGTNGLRRLTILHEMVHVVAGPDECRAMAFAARVEHLATGSHTPVDRYWQANGCEGGAFSLP